MYWLLSLAGDDSRKDIHALFHVATVVASDGVLRCCQHAPPIVGTVGLK